LHKTMAELSMSEKNAISHRGKAAEAARKILQQ
jgi:inosine/xanthosine triphosphate pyrophosphatase family protein